MLRSLLLASMLLSATGNMGAGEEDPPPTVQMLPLLRSFGIPVHGGVLVLSPLPDVAPCHRTMVGSTVGWSCGVVPFDVYILPEPPPPPPQEHPI